MACSPKSSPAPCLHPRRYPRCRRFTWLSPLPPILPRRTRFTSGLLLHTLLPPRCTPYGATCYVPTVRPCASRPRCTPYARRNLLFPCYMPCASSLLVFLCAAICYHPAVRHVRRDPAISPLRTFARRTCYYPCCTPCASRVPFLLSVHLCAS